MTALTMIQKRQEMARAKKAEIDLKMGNRERPVKAQDGRSKWRILPSWRGAEDPDIAQAFGQHYVKDINGDLKAVHVCLEKTWGKPCPICSALTNAIRHSNDETQKILEESKSSGGYLVNALNLDGKEPNKVVILQLGSKIYQELLDLIDQYADDGLDLIDLKTGFDVIITRSGKGLTTKYAINASPKSTSISPSVLDGLFDLDKYVMQEHAETELKALNVVDSIATGRLPSPKAGSMDDDDEDILEGEYEEDVKKLESKASAPKSSKNVSDQEIDDLLGDLEDLDLD